MGSGSGRDVPTRRWLGCASRRVCAVARAKRGAAPACLGGKRRPSARMAIVCGAIARAGTWTGRRLQPGRQSTHCWQCVAKVMCGLWRSPLCRLWQLLSPRAYSGGTRGSPPAWCNCVGRGEWGAGREVWGAGCRVQGAGCRVQGAGCRVQGAGRRRAPAVGEGGGTLQVVELYPRGGQVARYRGDAHDARRGRGAQQRHEPVRQQEVSEIVHLRGEDGGGERTRAAEEARDGEREERGCDGEHA